METKQNRYNTKQNMVTLAPEAAPVVRKMSAEESRILEHYAAPAPTIMVEQAFQAQEGADERTSGKDRSVALVIRLLPITAIWLVLSIGIVWKFNLQNNDAVLIFAALTALTFYSMDKNERYDSKHGVEHHKIDSAVFLTERKLEHDQELKKMALEATLKQLEVRNGNEKY